MKTIVIRVIFTIAAFATIAIVFWPQQRPSEPRVAKAEPSDSRLSETTTPAAPITQRAESSGEIRKLKERLAKEEDARERAETEAAELRKQMARFQNKVVVSLGTVEDMGKRAGALLPDLSELQTLSSRDPSTLSPEEKQRLLQLQRDQAQLLGALPEIAHFQDNPAEYGRFFSNMLQQAAGLTDEQASQVEAYMSQRATEMNQNRLNTSNQPTDPELKETWEQRRDKFNALTADGLNAVLPPGAAEKAGIGPSLMEFLEMDFDKLNTTTPSTKAQ